jgi:hypothetical protein
MFKGTYADSCRQRCEAASEPLGAMTTNLHDTIKLGRKSNGPFPTKDETRPKRNAEKQQSHRGSASLQAIRSE